MNVFVEKFADIKILRYSVPEFEKLELNKKIYIYYLSQAALCGRDILWDQNNRHNLAVRAVLENIFKTYSGNRESEMFSSFLVYLKRVWFSNGIHHHYSTEKIPTGFSEDYFDELVDKSDWKSFKIPSEKNFTAFIAEIKVVILNPETEQKRVNLEANKDLILSSANNYYQNVSQIEAEEYYSNLKSTAGTEPVSFGLNSTLVKESTQITEKIIS